MEETRSIEVVGNYGFSQADEEDCQQCHKAKMGTVLIDGLCIDCFKINTIEAEKVLAFLDMAIESTAPELELFDAIEDMIKNRHLPINLSKYLRGEKGVSDGT